MNPTTFEQLMAPENLDMIFRGVVIYFFVIWFCIVVWVVKDITNRTNSVLFQIFSVLLVLILTPLGIFIYLLIRPQKTVFERVFEKEFLEMNHQYYEESQHPQDHKKHTEHTSEHKHHDQ